MVGEDVALKYWKKEVKSKSVKMGVEEKKISSVFGNNSVAMTENGVQMKRKGVSRLAKGKNDANTTQHSIAAGDVVMNGGTTEEKIEVVPKKQRRGADGVIAEAAPEASACKLRPRNSGPSFRKVELHESDLKKIVGKRVKIYWDGSRRWFPGCIMSFDNKRKLHSILYDDGDKEDLDLLKERIELEVMNGEAFSFCSNIKKESPDGSEARQEVKKHMSVDMDDLEAVKRYSNGSKNDKVKPPIKTKLKPHKQKSLKDLAADMDRDIKVNVLPKSSKNQVPDGDDLGGDKERGGVLSSRLRPRKSVPHFQKVDLNEKDSEKIVGKRVKVYWSGSRRWFAGRIFSFDKERKLHKVIYDDGDKEDLDLKKERIELELIDTEDFCLLNLKSESKSADKARVTQGKTDVFAKDIKMEAHRQNHKDQIINVKFDRGKRKSITKKESDEPLKKQRREMPSTPNSSGSNLRPRKLLPSFRKVELGKKDFASVVGKRVKVYWSGSRRWFVGQIKSYDSKKKLHTVLYEDGDKEELDLMEERFELEVTGAEPFNIC